MGFKVSAMPSEFTLGAHPTKDKFLHETRRYISALLSAANPENFPRLMVDQLAPSSGINKFLRYFDCDVKVIIVDRDPRDVFLSDKYIWRTGITPRDPEIFCKWFRDCHESNKNEILDPNHVLKVQFENLVYNYDNEKRKIEEFLGLQNVKHLRPFEGFNPRRSLHNTQLWRVFDDSESLNIIESLLSDYLFNYEQVKENIVVGKEVGEIKRF